MKFNLPPNITFVLDTLLKNGHKAYIVGGCVRDLLCGKTPNDYDITTSALPHETQSLFQKTVATGLKHGTVTVIVDDTNIEITTFRTEGIYHDSRHPENVNFVKDVKHDLARRDFTINAMCYNDSAGLIDLFGGINDIKNKTLRTVGNAEMRFNEDALRILRLFRFASTLHFCIEKETFNAAIKCAPLLSNISAERIFTELKKASLGNNVDVLSSLLKTKALGNYYLKMCDLTKLNCLPQDENLRTFALLYVSSTNFSKTLDTLKCSNSFKEYCLKLSDLLATGISEDKTSIKTALNFTDYDIFCDYLKYLKHFLDIDISKAKTILDEIINLNEPYKISHLNITGNDIINLGFDGIEVGKKLQFLLDETVKNPSLNTREKLLSLICN